MIRIIFRKGHFSSRFMIDVSTAVAMAVLTAVATALETAVKTHIPHDDALRIIHAPHKDSSEPHITGNYYLNETDGDTVIYNETTPSKEYTIKERVKPIQNSWHQFDGNYYHSSSAPVNNEKRIVLTYNFTTQEFK